MRTFPADHLHAVYAAIARRMGADAQEAEIFARCFVLPDLRGKETQGIACVSLVYPWLRNGAARFGAPFTVVQEGPSHALVDGGHGVGQVVATRAMELAIRKAREATVGCVWVRNTSDFTAASNYALQALEAGMVGVAMSNGVPLVAPWGGRDPVFNTNPISVAIPAGQHPPIVIDMAASATSHGKVVLAARDGKPLAGPWLVDEDGRVTADAVPYITDVLDRNSPQTAAILPLGAKGFAWLLIVEVFAGLMSGMGQATRVPFNPTPEDPPSMGHFLMAIDAGRLLPLANFTRAVDGLIDTIKASRLAEGFDEIRLPGERAARLEQRQRREGVSVRDEEWAKIVAIARELELDLDALSGSGAARS
jgi:LDH2 family malate/lactate/ureidoglycolate dehydrogenase